jgi:hypothetical protein
LEPFCGIVLPGTARRQTPEIAGRKRATMKNYGSNNLPNSTNAIPYRNFTVTVTATNATETLSFHGFDATISILLDNVSLTLAAPSPPRLSLGLSPANKLVFTWTSPANGFRLQASAFLAASNWVTLTNTPVTAGSSNQIVLPPPAETLFYRLALP